MKKILLYIGLTLATILIVLVLVAALFEDKIGEKILTELNKSLKTKVETKGFDLSLIKSFPNARATLKGIMLPDALDGTALLEAEELSFSFNMFSLFGSNIRLNSVLIKNGAFFLRYDKKGRPNYDVFKPTPKKETNNHTELSISLENAILEAVEMSYADEQTALYVKSMIEQAKLAGKLSTNRFDLTSDATFTMEFLESAGERYFIGKQMTYDAKIDVDVKNGRYILDRFIYKIGKNTFDLRGDITKENQTTNYDLAFQATECTLESLLEILSERQQTNLLQLKSKGNIKVSGSILGTATNDQNPAINFSCNLKNGSINSPKMAESLSDISFDATFSNGKARNKADSFFKLENFKGKFGAQPLKLALTVHDLEKPFVDFQMDGTIPIDAAFGLFNAPSITKGSGTIDIQSLNIKGEYANLINPALISQADISGKVMFEDAMLGIYAEEMTLKKGTISVGNTTLVEGLQLVGANSDISLEGRFENLLPVLLADSLNSKKAELIFDAKLTAERLDLGELMSLTNPENTAKGENITLDSARTERIQSRERLTNFLKGSFHSNIKEFLYNKIKANDFVGTLQFDNNEMLVNGAAQAMSGELKVDGKMFFEEKPRLETRVYSKSIDVKELFRQCESFGQTVLTHQHLKGKLDAQVSVNAFWETNGAFNYDKLRVLADLSLTNGELNNFTMLEDFSSYVKLKDLRNIRFTRTRNWFEIKKQVIHIPVMFIQTNAMNLTLNGTHSFEQDIEYNIKVNAGQVVWNKLFKRSSDKPVKEKNGWFNLYYKIYGTLDKFEFKSDKAAIKNTFERSEIHKVKIKKEMEEIFGKVYALETDEEPTPHDDSTPPTQSESPPTTPQPQKQDKPTNKSYSEDDDDIIEGY